MNTIQFRLKRIAAFLVLSITVIQGAESPTLIPYQGRITDQQGNVFEDGQFTLSFSLYEQEIDGEPIWTERHERAGLVNGMVNVFLGSIESLSEVDFSEVKYLGITVDADHNPATADPEMIPRQMIIPAFFAKNAAKLAGHDWSAILEGGSNDPTSARIDGSRISIGGIGSEQIADGSVTFSDLAPEVLAGMDRGTIQQGQILDSMTALEPIARGQAVAVTKSGGEVRLFLANASTGGRSAFFGMARQAAAAGDPVVVQQFGPLEAFSGLEEGVSYFLSDVNGGLTSILPETNPIYVGYALSDTTIFVDPFGFSRRWSDRNYWGDGSDGAFSSGSDVFLPSEVDGEVVVRQYEHLTINAGHTLTVENRCRGLAVYVKGNCTINGTLSMTRRGANVDPSQPDSISPEGIRLARRKSGGTDSLDASDLGGAGAGGVGTIWKGVEARQPGIVNNGIIYTISREGGAGGIGGAIYNGGLPGGTMANGTGGGGAGSGSNTYPGGHGAAGTCYSGGAGGGSPLSGGSQAGGENMNGSAFGGRGGHGTSAGDVNSGGGGAGAGNPGGTGGGGGANGVSGKNGENGTGGLLLLFVRGNLTIGPSGVIAADGARGGNGGVGGAGSGGGSGGGRLLILYAGTFQNQGTVRADGGSGGMSNYQGKAGGNGSITIDQIDP